MKRTRWPWTRGRLSPGLQRYRVGPWRIVLVVVLLSMVTVGCGRKGPPKPLKPTSPRTAYDKEKETLTRVVVTGATGRMGKRVLALIHADPALELAGAITHAAHPALGRDSGDVAGTGPLDVPLGDDLAAILPQADVVIDFSIPEATITALHPIAEQRKAMVIGTTGFTAAQQEEIVRLGQTVPCFLAPNMSIGVHVMLQALRQLVNLLGPDYDVEILEAHHRTKVDAPSGTALRIASIIAEEQGRKLDEVAVYGRQGMIGQRSHTEIGIQVMRAGDIVGEHTVLFGGIGERLELIHRSHSRDTFAQGAIRAAHWLAQQPPGLYGMDDLLRPAL